jgi:hypothetical protein
LLSFIEQQGNRVALLMGIGGEGNLRRTLTSEFIGEQPAIFEADRPRLDCADLPLQLGRREILIAATSRSHQLEAGIRAGLFLFLYCSQRRAISAA